mmetsp:Transcript_143745/g.460062  ORF Transcript_143745/g.460062 Transcript_143745/m.460062 type:complete len:247 (-) Transcript_143745:1199-1939(-)
MGGDELGDHGRIGQRRGVAQVAGGIHVLPLLGDLPQDPPHDLARPRLRKRGCKLHRVWSAERPQDGSHMFFQGLVEVCRSALPLLQSDVGIEGLTLHVVGDADDRRLRHAGIGHERGLHLGGADVVAAHDDDVVDAPGDPIVAIGIPSGAVAGQVVAGEREVSLPEALGVAPDSAEHGGPGVLDCKQAFDVVPFDLAPRDVQQRGLHAEEGSHGAPGLLRPALRGQRGDRDRACLRLPPRVGDRAP